MLNLLAATALLLQPAELAPSLLPGTHEWFLQACQAVEENLATGKFDQAAKAARALPDHDITLTWVDKKVPLQDRPAFIEAREAAIKEWKQQFPELTIRLVPQKGEVLLSFEPTLAVPAGMQEPAGAVFFTSVNPADPNVEGVFALFRTSKKLPSTPKEIYNETLFAIGVHLGLQQTPGVGLVSNRHDSMYSLRNRVSSVNLQLVQHNLEAVKTLRAAIASKKRLAPNLPQIYHEPVEKRFQEKVVQGTILKTSIAITNRGSGELQVRLVPDCGCFRVSEIPPIAAGETIAAPIEVHTQEFPGKHRKRVIIYSNDAHIPVREFFVEFHATPRYRILTDQRMDTFQVAEDGTAIKIFMFVSPEKPFKIKNAGISGVAGAVEWEEWSGNMADPQLNEPEQARSGFVFNILCSPDVGLGRRQATLAIETDDPLMPNLFKTFWLQRGIAISAPELFLGTLGKRSVQAQTLLIRPDRKFRVLKLETDSEFLTAKYDPIEDGHQYRVTVLYKGGAPVGYFSGKVTVHTDDPDQPKLVIEVTGNVQ